MKIIVTSIIASQFEKISTPINNGIDKSGTIVSIITFDVFRKKLKSKTSIAHHIIPVILPSINASKKHKQTAIFVMLVTILLAVSVLKPS